MTAELFRSPLFSYLWQVSLHSFVAALVAITWLRHLALPSGRARRQILTLLLVVPLLTAAVPGRGSVEFRESFAFFESERFLVLPLVADLRVFHAVVALGLVTAFLFVVQEVLPALPMPRPGIAPIAPSERLLRISGKVRCGADCRLGVLRGEGIAVATGGWPGARWLEVSSGALERLGDAELEAVLRHENAHWRPGRWWVTHALFVVRAVQLFNPLALWIFREYSIEVELECDREAAAAVGVAPMARALLAVYRTTRRRDTAARATLQRRVDVLLGRRAFEGDGLGEASVAVMAVLFLGALPWLL